MFQTFDDTNQRPSLFVSRPVQNARSPLACSTTAWMSSVSRTVSQAHVNSAAISSLNELSASGRSRVIVAT